MPLPRSVSGPMGIPRPVPGAQGFARPSKYLKFQSGFIRLHKRTELLYNLSALHACARGGGMQVKMTSDRHVGISDIGLYVPPPEMNVESLIERRVRENPQLNRHLERAGRVTGQEAFRFPEMWEDGATLAARAAYTLLHDNPAIDPKSLRHLIVGTETGVDHSKPVSAYVQGMLQRSGIALPTSLSSFQIQHACAGGTFALISVASLLAVAGQRADSGLVISSDIARYETKSTAEITQGAGAVALHVEAEPRLVELDISTMGFCSRDVDDFFRPLGSTTARVNGSYSMKCYWESLQDAFLDYCARAGEKPDTALLSTDYFVLHTPFRKMPGNRTPEALRARPWLQRGADEGLPGGEELRRGVDPIGRIGNIYNGSLFAVLAFLLHERHQALGKGIVGKRILFASYGSGNTMIVFSGARGPLGAGGHLPLEDGSRAGRLAARRASRNTTAGSRAPCRPTLYAELLARAAFPSGRIRAQWDSQGRIS